MRDGKHRGEYHNIDYLSIYLLGIIRTGRKALKTMRLWGTNVDGELGECGQNSQNPPRVAHEMMVALD